MIKILLVILLLPITAATDAIIDGNNWFGTSDQESYRLLVHYFQEGDKKAFNNALADAIQHMRATKFRNREAVYVEKRDGDLVSLRRPGEVYSYWTDKEAIR